MKKAGVLEGFDSLPPEAQKQVLDFISFLQTRYKIESIKRKPAQAADFSKEAFIGIWREREEMGDSTSWVRTKRECEWG